MLSVITNIGLDHTEFLGDTLEKIAAEKAGIIKEGIPCVIGETASETAPVFIHKAEECHILGQGPETTDCKIWFADQCGYLNRCRKRDIPDCQLHGLYQEKNMQTAYVALSALKTQIPALTTEAIRKGFAEVCTLTGLRGRWEILNEKPLTVCDTGHNSHGIRYVAEQLIRLQQTHQGVLRMVFGMVDDKDVDVVMRLLPRDAVYYFTQAATHRAIPARKMQEMWGEGLYFPSVAEAIEAARKDAADNDILFIGGSNYVVGEALPLFWSGVCDILSANSFQSVTRSTVPSVRLESNRE